MTTAASAVGCELLRDQVARYGQARIKAQGTSMLPNIWPGEVLHILRVPVEQFAPGQIAVFYREQRICAHRVISVTHKPFAVLTQGDRLSTADAPITKDELLGVVTGVRRRGRLEPPRTTLSWQALLLRWMSRLSDLPTCILLKSRYTAESLWTRYRVHSS